MSIFGIFVYHNNIYQYHYHYNIPHHTLQCNYLNLNMCHLDMMYNWHFDLCLFRYRLNNFHHIYLYFDHLLNNNLQEYHQSIFQDYKYIYLQGIDYNIFYCIHIYNNHHYNIHLYIYFF